MVIHLSVNVYSLLFIYFCCCKMQILSLSNAVGQAEMIRTEVEALTTVLQPNPNHTIKLHVVA